MWQRTAIIIVVGLECLSTLEARGADPGYADTLLSDLNWVRFELVMGRLLATGHRTRQDRQRATRRRPDGADETLIVTLDRGLVSLNYDCRSATCQLALEVVRRDRVELEVVPGPGVVDVPRVGYVQTPGEDIALSVGRPGESLEVYRARSLWHLWLAQPEVCQTHLEPWLGLFQCDGRIDAEAQEIRTGLLDCSLCSAPTGRGEVMQLVAQLCAPDFGVRQQATRALRAHGPRVLGFLEELDPATLDAEQRFRVRRVQRELTAVQADTPGRMVSWLMSDPAAWLALLHDPSPAHRQHAERQLAYLRSRPGGVGAPERDLLPAAQLAELPGQSQRR